MAEALVSIIIPIKELSDLSRPIFDDIKNQTYPNIEVITDDSYGVSHARNVALSKAQGKYVCFFDCDDRIDPEIISYLTDEIDGVTGAACGYDISVPVIDAPKAEPEVYGEVFYETPETVSRVLSGADMLCRIFFEQNYEGYLWNKIFRLDLIRKHKIHFQENLWYKEDCAFVADYLKYARLFRMSPARLYHYLENEGSLVQSADFQTKENFSKQEAEEDGKKQTEPMTDELKLFEKRLTELSAYQYMRKSLFKKPYEDARFFCGMNMAIKELNFFYEILTKDPERQFDYKDFSLRKFAKGIKRLPFEPGDNETEMLYDSFIKYGKTGSSLDPGMLEQELQ